MTWELHDKMAEKTRFYLSKNERQIVIDDERQRKFHMLHDDFVDSLGNATDGNSGRITFTNIETKEPAKSKRTLSDALVQLLSDKGIESDVDISKLEKILGRETLSVQSSLVRQDTITAKFKKMFKREK